MIAERLKRARAAAGLSQRALGERAGLSAMAISKFERGEAAPASGTLLRLARATGVRVEYLLRSDTVTLEKVEYRKRSSLGAKQLARVEADVLEQVERFVELVGLFPVSPVPTFTVPKAVPNRIRSMDQVEDVAIAVRDAWNLGHDALPNLSDTLEEHGLIVLTSDVDTTGKFDGLAARVDGRPVVVVGQDWPGDRQRFTIAHELGHLILDGRLAPSLELEAASNRFAGAFIAPRDAVMSELGAHRTRIEPRELYALKHEYGLSMMALVFRARDAGVITPQYAASLFRLFAAKGWRKREPGQAVPAESPKVFDRLVARALAEDMFSLAKGAELMGLSLDAFRKHLSLEDDAQNAWRTPHRDTTIAKAARQR